jgi:hypothetical protein
MTAARVRLGALLLAVLVGLSVVAGAGGHGLDSPAAGDPAPAVDEGLHTGDVPAVVQSASDQVRSLARPETAPLVVLGLGLVALAAASVLTLGEGVPAVPSGATAHVRRRGPPSCA